MKLCDIISNSFKYPAGDLKKFLIICVLFALPIIPVSVLDFMEGNVEILVGLAVLLFIIDVLIIPGYFISIVGKGCSKSKSVPSIRVGRNIINTFKYIVLNIVYSLVPLIVLVIGVYALGLSSISVIQSIQHITSITDLVNLISNFFNSIVIVLTVFLIVSWIFSLLAKVAIARFANYNKLSEAFKKIIGDIKEIGVLKLIAWFIVMGIIMSIIFDVSALLTLIPYVGVFLYFAVIVPYIVMMYCYSLGLLYSGVEGSEGDFDSDDFDSYDFDLDEFEKEILDIRKRHNE